MVYINSPPQTNTFQVGLVTDGTFGFAIFNYEEDQMLWNVAALASKNVIIGFNTGSGQYVNTQFQDPPFSTIADRFRPDQFVGNTGLGGRWIYRLEANNDTTINPKKFCLDWYDVQPAHQDWSRFLGTCPCTFSQAGNDRRLRSPGRRGGAVSPVGNSYRRLSKEVLDEIEERQAQGLSFCLQTAISPSGNGAGMTCCYRSDTSLIDGYGTTLESSFIERYQFRFGVDNNPLLLLSYIR
ncbi:putative fibrillin-1 [Apostichopus japonicus]|uniref:Putative fibrillin-1 n=1 Tax=Stichopus japonicus TaxID=307972 RepID=A0A2G8LP30_STIJA|nr:putative fibrillin-1 [Apostichopus japonicus]